MERIQTGKRGRKEGKLDRVFCLIYTRNAYIDGERCSLVLAQMRHDGMLGFPGGKVEEHHSTLRSALRDELKQEINLVKLKEEKLKMMATFADEKRHVTTYKYEVDFKTFENIQKTSCNAEHFYLENMGCIALKITEDSLKNIRRQKFRGTGKLELDILINQEGLLDS